MYRTGAPIGFVANNIGRKYDGIGHFSSRLLEPLQNSLPAKIRMFHGTCRPRGLLHDTICVGMLGATLRLLVWSTFVKPAPTIILQYPFVDKNPLSHLVLIIALDIIRFRRGKIILMLHEYFRVAKTRKDFIDLLLRHCNIAYISAGARLTYRPSSCSFRQFGLPSNIQLRFPIGEKRQRHSYVYFGLIGRNKAFGELLTAWQKFCQEHPTKHLSLSIATATRIPIGKIPNNVTLRYGLSDEDVSRLLVQTEFGFLPIRPMVTAGSGSLQAIVSHGVVPIAKFAGQIDCDGFISMQDYSEESFLEVIGTTERLTESDVSSLRAKIDAGYGPTRNTFDDAVTQLVKDILGHSN